MVDDQKNSQTLSQVAVPGGASQAAASGGSALVRRRLLLKGVAAGVPAIITLQSGAALAAASATCVTRGESFGTQVRCKTSEPTTSNWLHVLDSDAFWSGNGPCAPTEWAAVYVSQDGTAQKTGNYGGNGSPTAAPDTANGYYAISKSCWSSFGA